MSAALVLTRLRVVSATTPASRKFHGTMASARCSRRLSVSLLRSSDCSTMETMERSLVPLAPCLTRTKTSPSSTAVPA